MESNKVFEYKGYKFNICVNTNSIVERRINGTVLHSIVTNCMDGSNYYHKREVVDSLLIEAIEGAEVEAKKWVDIRENTEKLDPRLEKLGFK